MIQPRPIIVIKKQSTSSLPVNGDSTIMDDTVMTMDGVGLMGGPVGVTVPLKVRAVIPRYYTTVRKRR
jgi:hypothetical protein